MVELVQFSKWETVCCFQADVIHFTLRIERNRKKAQAPQQLLHDNKEDSLTLSCLMICAKLNRLSHSVQHERRPLKFECEIKTIYCDDEVREGVQCMQVKCFFGARKAAWSKTS